MSKGNEMSLVSRLDKIAATLAAKQSPRQDIVRRVMGDKEPQDVLDRMIGSGEIAEHQRGDVRFMRRVIVEPIWDMGPDGSARLIGRRNVHTGEIELVEGWGG
jgi:hypothetical protein